MKDFEPRFANAETVKLGQTFPLFSDGTEDLRGTQVTDVRGYDRLAYRTPLVLDVGFMRVPFQAQFAYSNFEVAQTLTPFDPDLGYRITAEDFDPFKRAEKLIANMARYSRWIENRRDLLQFNMANLINPTRDPDVPVNLEYCLRLLVETPGGGLVGFPIESENVALHISSFYPADTPRPAEIMKMVGSSDVMRELEGKYGVESREYQFVGFINTWFDLAVPDDPEKLRTMTGQFIIEEPGRRKYKSTDLE